MNKEEKSFGNVRLNWDSLIYPKHHSKPYKIRL